MNTNDRPSLYPITRPQGLPFLRIGTVIPVLLLFACRTASEATTTATAGGAARPAHVENDARPEATVADAETAFLPPVAMPAPIPAAARPRDPWEITLAGTGANDDEFNTGAATAAASVGFYFSEVFELSARQTVSFVEAGSSSWDFTTRGAFDVHLPLDAFRPFIGVNAGFTYGESTDEGMIAGPEAGVKIYIKKDVFILGMAEYLGRFDESDEIDDAFEDGTFVYTIGLGVRL